MPSESMLIGSHESDQIFPLRIDCPFYIKRTYMQMKAILFGSHAGIHVQHVHVCSCTIFLTE